MTSEVYNRRILSSLMLAVAITSLTYTGCSQPIRRLGIIDELAISYRDQVWARRAYNLRFANCNRQFESHFENGFCAGYSDVCNGGDGFVPALPPDEYRGFEYQCAEGSNCIDAWFDGYPAGVAAAREERVGKYHEVRTSNMIDRAISQQKAPNKLPADVPVTKPNANLIPPTATAKRLGPLPKSVKATSVLPKMSERVFGTSQPVSVARNGASRLTPSTPRVAQSTLPLSAQNATRNAPPVPLQPVRKATETAPQPVRTPAPATGSSTKPSTSPQPSASSAPPIITAHRNRRVARPQAPLEPGTALIASSNSFTPPIIRRGKPQIETQAIPAVQSIQPVSHGTELPPTYRGQKMDTSARALLPPIIRGNKIDPSATVTEAETSAPLYYSSRTARQQSTSGSQTR